MLAYVCDESLRKQFNRREMNYWETYVQEIFELLGARGEAVSLSDLENAEKLGRIRSLVLGWQAGAALTATMKATLTAWVKAGGLLIGFGTVGLDEVFGIKSGTILRQEPDDYTQGGGFDLRDHPLTHELHPAVFIEQKLLIYSDIRPAALAGATELSRLYDPAGKDLKTSAVTWNRFGQGLAGYFAFDVAKTIWRLHQGRPLPGPTADRPYPRAADLQILGENSRKIPYADEMCFLIQNMLAQQFQPFIYQIPPQDGKVPDAILYYGGDEYEGPAELSLAASDWMKEKGLGYHINTLETHPMTPEQQKHILDNGHELGQYYGLHKEDNFAMKEEYYAELHEAYVRRFGIQPVTTVNKWLRWQGWSEPAKWMQKAGGQADNSFHGNTVSFDNYLANGPVFAFGFGTSYPFFFYDDAAGDNRRIEFLEQPIICYEIGHRGSIQDYETQAHWETHLPVETAIKYHLVMNMFYHPVYIAKFPNCRKALEEILNYIRQRGALVLHWGNDRVTRWWKARSQSTVHNVKIEDRSISFDCRCEYPDGMIVKFLLHRRVEQVSIDHWLPCPYEIRKEFAGEWVYIPVPRGEHHISIRG